LEARVLLAAGITPGTESEAAREAVQVLVEEARLSRPAHPPLHYPSPREKARPPDPRRF
jgi:hypothetical protein